MMVSRKAVVLATIEQQIALGANFLIAVLTSRFISPQEIGITVIGAAIVGIVTALREYAAPSFLIANAELSREETAGALTGGLALNLLLTGALVLAAPLFAALYSDDRLITYLRIIALGLFMEAFTSPIVAVARRDMAVGNAATIGIIGTVTLLVTTVALAAFGYGYISLAWGILVSTSASAVAAVAHYPTFWFIRPSVSAWSNLFRFGGYNGTNSILRQMYESVPYLVLGHILSFEAAAYYHRALMLSQLPGKLLLGGVEALMLPALAAQLRRSDDLKPPLLHTLQCITVVYWPLLILMSVLAEPIIILLYGRSWLPGVPLLQIMALASLFLFMGKLDTSVLIAVGGLHDMLKRSLTLFPICTVISVTSALFGAAALAWSSWLSYSLQLILSVLFLQRYIALSWKELASAATQSIWVTVAASAVPLAFLILAGGHDVSFSQGIVVSLVACAIWLIALWRTQHPLYLEVRRPARS